MGVTLACFSVSGNFLSMIILLIRLTVGLSITLSARCIIFDDNPSSPVAFRWPILPRYRETRASSTGLNSNSDSTDGAFARIALILG